MNTLLYQIIYSIGDETNCPIGNSISTWFGNIYMNELDQYVKHFLRCRCYLRYCDDFFVFSNDINELHWYVEQIRLFLLVNLHLGLSFCDIYHTYQGVHSLGYVLTKNCILLKSSTKDRILAKVERIMNTYEKYNTEEEFITALSVFGSYNGVLCHCDSFNLRKSIQFETKNNIIKEDYQNFKNNRKS